MNPMGEKNTMKIYIIRHGETEANKEGLLQGWTDYPLNEFGRELAELTADALSGVHFDAAVSSPLLRARETAEIILSRQDHPVPLTFDDRLKEINMGDNEGVHFREIPDLVTAVFKDPLHAGRHPNGESIFDVMERTQAFLKELAATGEGTVLVSMHGCALRCMLNFLYDDPTDFWQGQVPLNCCVNIIEVTDGNIRLVEKDKIFYDDRYKVDRYRR